MELDFALHDMWYAARDVVFADDLQSFGATLEDLQQMADLVFTITKVFNLRIATHKLKSFHHRGGTTLF